MGDRGDVAEDVFDAMVQLGHQQALSLLRLPAFRNIQHGADDTRAGCRSLAAGHGLTPIQEPAHLSIPPHNPELDLATVAIRPVAQHVRSHHLPLLRVNELERSLDRERGLAFHADDAPKIRRPIDLAGGRFVVVGAEARRLAGEAQSLLALAQLLGRRLQRGRPFDDAALELAVELLQLAGFSVELDEYLDLGAQDLGDHGYRNVVDRARLVATDAVDIGQM